MFMTERVSSAASDATRDCYEWLYDDDPETEWLRQAYAAIEAEFAGEMPPVPKLPQAPA